MAKNLMIQGTMSNAGKSLVTAGILRVMKQDGFRVAPFKSQNMALNSFITEEGLEMGRAQVMQAESAGILPEVAMNPILLKPTTDVGSQVIVNGEVLGNFTAKEYFKMKKSLIPSVLKAYQSLAEKYDVIVIEGAGSPAEINLKSDDIVNMGLAKLLDAPVLLVGDIDRGGVFAQLYGTIALLEKEEQTRVKGLIINKFRGDRGILEPGIQMLEELCKKEVVGVLPWTTLDIEDEDSLSERFSKKEKHSLVKIGIIRFPHISNFTDFNPLELLDGVSVEYITKIAEWTAFDMVILPGTKSTMEDLVWLRESGLESKIIRMASQGGLILGICGGYQMLGEELEDKEGIESGKSMRGIGLLPVKTTFEKSKVRTRKEGNVCVLPKPWESLSGAFVSGYEIHMGRTMAVEEGQSFCFLHLLDRKEESADGFVKKNVCGTYLHGLFEEEQMLQSFVALLYERKGYHYSNQTVNWQTYKERQYDMLAEMIRQNMDMKKLYQIMGLTKKE